MEYQLHPFPIFLSFFLFIFMILRIWKLSKNNHHSTILNPPPGPRKLPLIGNMHLLAGSLPHRRLKDLATKYGPSLMHLKLGEVSHIVVSSVEAAKEVMRNHDLKFAQRPPLTAARVLTYNFTDIAFAEYGEYWRQLRKICTLEMLSLKRVQSYRTIREEEVSNLMRAINSSSSAGLPINFTKMVFSLSNDITARAAFGGRRKDREELKQVFQKIIELGGGFSLADMFPSVKLLEMLSGMRSEIQSVHKKADTIFGNIINDHRAFKAMGEAQALMYVLLDIQEHGDLQCPLTNDNIKAVLMNIFIGGSETSSTTIEWAMSEMLKNPRVMEKAQAEVRKAFEGRGNVEETGLDELRYLRLVIKETLRLHPALPLLLPRECRESCRILGYDIPVGSKVIVNAWAIGRDPRYWDEPESFYPERFLGSSVDYKGTDFEYIPFGAGRRMCPGVSFGMINVEFSLAKLLYHFNWKLANGIHNKDIDMTEAFGATVTRKNDLYLIPIPHHPPQN